jgi:PD-(D/E)XK nuclease superfamily protein
MEAAALMSTSLVHEIHASEVKAFLQCRQHWDWKYRDRWEPNKTPKPLEFGRAWHAALAELYSPARWGTRTKLQLYKDALGVFIAECELQQDEYLHRTGRSVLEPEAQEDYADRRLLGRSMLENLVRSLDVDKYKPIAVEQEYFVPLRGLYCNCRRCLQKWNEANVAFAHNSGLNPGAWTSGLPVVFGCRIDAIFEDKHNSLWVVDHKSAAQLLSEVEADYLQIDLQLALYLWAISQQLDVAACGAIYNQFRKAYPKPPKLLQHSPEGRLYSVNRMQLTDHHTALRTFKQDKWAYTRGLYDEYLEWLKLEGKDYFKQFKIFKTAEQLEVAKDNLYLVVAEMLANNLEILPNPSKMVCNRCDFFGPCLSNQSGHNYMEELTVSYTQTEPWYERDRKRTRHEYSTVRTEPW